MDGDLSGGLPKAIELYVVNDVADLSVYGFGSANNGGGTDGVEYALSGAATAGDFLYIASEEDGFSSFFGFAPDFNAGTAASVNGDDAVELFYDAAGFPEDLSTYTGSPTVVDVFGDIDVDGNGQPWEYADGWAYRTSGTGPDGSTFVVSNWTYSGPGGLSDETTNATATDGAPVGTYSVDGGGEVSLDPVEFAFGFEEDEISAIGTWKNTSSDPGLTLTTSTDAVEGSSSLQLDYDFVADQSWGGSVDFGYEPEAGFVDLSAADGISFRYKTVAPVSNTTEVSFAVKLVDASAEAGVDNYEYRVPSVITDDSGEWTEVVIPFESFGLPSWLTPQDETFDLDMISAWQMQVVVGGGGVDGTYTGTVLLDDLALYTAPPEQTTIAEARAAGVGETVTITGTVTRAAGYFTYIQDETGGIVIRQSSGMLNEAVADGTVMAGTTLEVTGTISEYEGLLQINGSDLASYTVTGTADVPEAQTVTLAELASNGEAYEGELVTLTSVTIDPDGDTEFAERTNYQITDDSDATNAVVLRIGYPGDTEVDALTIPTGPATITAIVGQYDPDTSNDNDEEGYQLLPIAADDVMAMNTAAEDDPAAGLSLAVANPIQGRATVTFTVGAAGPAEVALFDVLGRRVAVLAEGDVAAGTQTAPLDAGRLAAGTYVLRLETAAGAVSRTVTVVR